MMTDKERQAALDALTKTRQAFLDALDGVTDAQARWKPAPERWSIFECAEHIAVSEDALLALVKKILAEPARPETLEQRKEREQKIRETPMPRGVNHAPHALRPTSRFSSMAEVQKTFLEARERTMEYARTTQEDLRSHFSTHPVLGPLDGYQWLVANARHAQNHTGHILELKTLPGFPQ